MGTKPDIMHTSDLHHSPGGPASNDELISTLITVRNHYIHADPSIAVPEAVVGGGDIVQGVSLDTDNCATAIDERKMPWLSSARHRRRWNERKLIAEFQDRSLGDRQRILTFNKDEE